MNKDIILIGYSGHSFVIYDIFTLMGQKVIGYCDSEEKKSNPFKLAYIGSELSKESWKSLSTNKFFVSIGNNLIRARVFRRLEEQGYLPSNNAIHPSSIISKEVSLGKGILVAANATINTLVSIHKGAICNTGSVIEHECKIGAFAHIAPGAVLAGNVMVGSQTFIGANSVVKQGVKIGDNVIIGAGSVILENIPNNVTVVGNPGRIIKTNL